MYCKHCGKLIDEDSSFCKYCGRRLSDGERSRSSTTKVGLKEKFTYLPQKYQIAMIVYAILLLGWICVLIGNSDERHFAEQYVLPFFLFTILIPFVIVSSIYIYKLRKDKRITITDMEYISEVKNPLTQNTDDVHSNLKKEITRKGVLSGREIRKEIQYDSFSDAWEFNKFLTLNGPLIEKAWHKNPKTNNEYCTLNVTNSSGNTISIRFHHTLGELTPSEIKERKNELFVVKRKDNNEYYLIGSNYEEWYEHLIL